MQHFDNAIVQGIHDFKISKIDRLIIINQSHPYRHYPASALKDFQQNNTG